MGEAANISCRPAAEDDFNFLWQLHRNSLGPSITRIWGWDETWQLDYFQERFDPSTRQIILYEGEKAGSLGVEWQEGALYIYYIAIVVEYQGRGIGTAIIEELIHQAGERGLPVTLSVLKGNPAKVLYERLGFVVTKEEDIRYWMARSL